MKLNIFTHLLLPGLGVVGISYGLLFANHSDQEPPKPAIATQVILPPSSAYAHAISGSGLVEANTRNIEVGSHLSGIVTEMFVGEGDRIEKGAPLFRLDDRAARAEISTAESNLAVAHAQLAEAQVSMADQRDQLARVEGLKAGVVVTVDRVSRLRFAAQTAGTRVSVAKAAVDEAQARLKAAKVTLDKLTVTSPIDGRVLKLSTRAGEFVQAGAAGGQAPMVVGNDTPLHVRVSLDENDLWRFSKEAKATGAPRSNRNVTFPLTFVRLEPYVVPKTSLTGATSERVDTRVLEVVYRVEATDAPVYIGQQVDVFVEETLPPAKVEEVVDAPAPEAAAAEPTPVVAEPALELPVTTPSVPATP